MHRSIAISTEGLLEYRRPGNDLDGGEQDNNMIYLAKIQPDQLIIR